MIYTYQTEPGFPREWEGLDYYSADDATPRTYGVSFGNGNDGVSSMYADYYVRTTEPWTLLRAATLGQFKPEFRPAVIAAVDENGEPEFGMSAVIYNPEDVDPAEAPAPAYRVTYSCDDCGHVWEDTTDEPDEPPEECPKCHASEVTIDETEELERGMDDDWCSANGAWFICEVNRGNDTDWLERRRQDVPFYDSLEECFSAEELEQARRE